MIFIFSNSIIRVAYGRTGFIILVIAGEVIVLYSSKCDQYWKENKNFSFESNMGAHNKMKLWHILLANN